MRRYEESIIEFDEIQAPHTKWSTVYEILDSFSWAMLLVMVLFTFFAARSGSAETPWSPRCRTITGWR